MNPNYQRLDYVAFAKQFYGENDFEYIAKLKPKKSIKLHKINQKQLNEQEIEIVDEIQFDQGIKLPQLKGKCVPQNFKVTTKINEFQIRQDETVVLNKPQRSLVPPCMKHFTLSHRVIEDKYVPPLPTHKICSTDIFRKQNILLVNTKKNMTIRENERFVNLEPLSQVQSIDLSDSVADQFEETQVETLSKQVNKLRERQKKSQQNINRQKQPVVQQQQINYTPIDQAQKSLLLHQSNAKLNQVINILINQLKFFAEQFDDSNQETKRQLIINKCEKYDTLTGQHKQFEKSLQKVRMLPNQYKSKYTMFQVDAAVVKQLNGQMIELSSVCSFHIEKATQQCQSCMTYLKQSKTKILVQIQKFNLKENQQFFHLQQAIKSQIKQYRQLEKRSKSDAVEKRLVSAFGIQEAQEVQKLNTSREYNLRIVLFPCGCSVCQNCIDDIFCPLCGVIIEKQVKASCGYQNSLVQKVISTMDQCNSIQNDIYELISIQELE